MKRQTPTPTHDTHLIRTVEAVIHEPCDYGRLANYAQRCRVLAADRALTSARHQFRRGHISY